MGVVDEFLSGRAARTADAYRRDLTRFAGYLDASLAQAVSRLLRAGQACANEMAQGFQRHLLDEGQSVSVCNRSLSALRSLTTWGRSTGRTTVEIHVDRVRPDDDRDTPDQAEMRRVLEHHKRQPDSVKNRRDVAMLSLLILGLRRGEMAGLDAKHVDLERNELSVLRERRSKRERVAMSRDTAGAIAAWLEVHGGYEPLLYSLSNRSQGNRMAGNSIWEATKRLGEDCGVKLWPRGMRRSVAGTKDA